MTDTVGYFNWRATTRGGVTYEKILVDHRTGALVNSNKSVGEEYRRNLLQETALGADDWKLHIDDLAKKFPLDPKALERYHGPKRGD